MTGIRLGLRTTPQKKVVPTESIKMVTWPFPSFPTFKPKVTDMPNPGHAHAITIEKCPNRIIVKFNEQVVADTKDALILREGPLPPMNYIPRKDAEMATLTRTTHSTHCPFKGDASYFSITVQGKTVDNAVWTYESPLSSVMAIKDHLAFYPEKMDSIKEVPVEEEE